MNYKILGLSTIVVLQSASLLLANTVSPLVDYFAVDSNVPNGAGNTSNGSSGTLNTGRLFNGNLAAGILTFDLPTEINAATLGTATLTLYLTGNTWGVTETASLEHTVSDNSTGLSSTRIYNSGYTVVAADFVNNNSTAGFFNLDVTDAIRSDYTAEGATAISVFRIGLDDWGLIGGTGPGEGDSSGTNIASDQQFLFASTENATVAWHPVLTLTTVPEPSTFAIIGGLIAMAVAVLRRRHA